MTQDQGTDTYGTDTYGKDTYNEIASQPQAWQEAWQVVQEQAADLLSLWDQGQYAQVVLTGCGSSYYQAQAVATLFQTLTGCPARAVPAGEAVMYPEAFYAAGRTLLIAISRSAETSEVIWAVQAFKATGRGEVIVLTNYGDRPLAALGDLLIDLPGGQEQSIAQTRSFAGMYVAGMSMSALLAGRADLLQAMASLPQIGQRLMARYESLAQAWGGDLGLDRFYFLGSGPRYGLACEANLKMKEMSLTHSEPFHFLEFRHGPKSMVGATAAVIGLLSDAHRNAEMAVLSEMAGMGGRTLSLGEADADVSFESGVPEVLRGVLYLPVLQWMAWYRARAKGLNPDCPHNLDAVVKLADGLS